MNQPVHVPVQMATVEIPVKVSGLHGGAANGAQVMSRICFRSSYIITCYYKCIFSYLLVTALCVCVLKTV